MSFNSPRHSDPKLVLEKYKEKNKGLWPPKMSEQLPTRAYLETPRQTPRVSIQLPSSIPINLETPIKFFDVEDVITTGESLETKHDSPTPEPQPLSDEANPEPPEADTKPPEVDEDERLDPSVSDERFLARYRAKLSVFREAYPKMMIPEIESTNSRSEILGIYDEYVKRIRIDYSVTRNSQYLLALWLIVETMGIALFNLPIDGYTKEQFKHMRKYHMLLVEIGERKFENGDNSEWPAEYQIIITAGLNATLFLIVKMLSSYTNLSEETIQNLTNMFMSGESNADVFQRANQTDADHKPEPASPDQPGGSLGSILSSLPAMLSNGGLQNIMAMFSGGNGGGSGGASKSPKVKKPKRMRRKRYAKPQSSDD